MSYDNHKKVLSIVWFGLSGLMFAFLFLYDMRGVPFAEHTNEVWSWLLPNIVPTLTLIISVLVLEAKTQQVVETSPSSFLFRLTLIVSIVYLLTLLVLLVYPANFTDQPPLEEFKASGIYLGPFQGVVTAALGAFFVKRK